MENATTLTVLETYIWLHQEPLEIVQLHDVTTNTKRAMIVPASDPDVNISRMVDFVHRNLPAYVRSGVPKVRIFQPHDIQDIMPNVAGLMIHDLREIWLRDGDDERCKGVFAHEYTHYVQSASVGWDIDVIFGSVERVYRDEIEAHKIEQLWYEANAPWLRRFDRLNDIEPYVREQYQDIATEMVNGNERKKENMI